MTKAISQLSIMVFIAILSASCGQKKSVEEYFIMGKDSLNVGNYFSAVESFKKVIEISPKQDKAYYYLGLAYSNSEINTNDAISAFKSAIDINPNYLEAYKKLVDVYMESHKNPEAIYTKTQNSN
jgi:tetratricopeptide (TPR) repeat protein